MFAGIPDQTGKDIGQGFENAFVQFHFRSFYLQTDKLFKTLRFLGDNPGKGCQHISQRLHPCLHNPFLKGTCHPVKILKKPFYLLIMPSFIPRGSDKLVARQYEFARQIHHLCKQVLSDLKHPFGHNAFEKLVGLEKLVIDLTHLEFLPVPAFCQEAVLLVKFFIIFQKN